MVRPPRKSPPKPSRRPAARPKPARAARAPKRTAAERKAKAIELILVAIASGWTIKRFALHAHIAKGTLLRWLAEDTIQPRFIRAMQAKALALPDEASEIVRRMIDGRRVIKRDESGELIKNPDGSFAFEIEYLDPKAGRAALSHIEFRMMREIKAGYQANIVHTVTDARQLSDEQLDQKFDELMQRHQIGHQGGAGAAQEPEND